MRFFFLVMAGFLFISSSAFAAGGLNSTKDTDLPLGAGGTEFVYLTASGYVNFGAAKASPKAWINTNDGSAGFGGPAVFNALATFYNGVSITSPNTTDLYVRHYIQSGDSAGGTGGLLVGPGQLFGSMSAGVFGLRNANNVWGLILDQNGNVGIGTTEPTAKLEVNGTAKVNGDLRASTLTIPGTVSGEALDAQKMDNIINISNLTACTGAGTIVLTKTGTNTYSCVAVPAGGFAYNGTIDCSSSGKVVVGFLNGVPQCGNI